MELDLGAHRIDVTHRAVVVAILPSGADTVPAGADAVEVAIGAQAPGDLPVCIDAPTAEALRLALDAGAAGVRAPAAVLGPRLDACASAGATVFAVGEHERLRRLASEASAAGIEPSRLVLEVAGDPARLRAGHDLAEAGALACVSADDLATLAAAVAGGHRVLRTTAVHRARRVADVIAAVSGAAA